MEENQNKNEYQDPFNSTGGSSDYGLPDVDFEPIKREEVREPVVSHVHSAPKKVEKEEENNYTVPIVIGIILLLLMLGGVGYYFFYMDEPVEEIVENYEPYQPETPVIVEEPEEITEEFTYTEPEIISNDPVEGSITFINERTYRSYIVVGSFFDEDNANDYGNLLASRGVEAKIIPATKGRRFYKLAVADFDTFDEAANQIGTYKETYCDEICVLKY
jgi:hypothetical protein